MTLSTSSKRILALSAIRGFGVKSFHLLLNELGSVERIWQASYEELLAYQLKPSICRAVCAARDKLESNLVSTSQAKVETWLEQERRYFIDIESAYYPALLKEVYGAPPFLFVEGCRDALATKAIAIVGSRNASSTALQNAHAFAGQLATAGHMVTSGLALGVDAAAHRGALDVSGRTLAVLATGLDVVYPKQHAALAEQVKECGAVVSEMQLGTMPIPANFPRRNRIVSGLSRGVLVVEASLKSGSLITAQFAIEQNREVYAIPGSIHNPMARGCHSLIKQGAALVETIDDIVSELGAGDKCIDMSSVTREQLSDLSAVERQVMSFIGFEKRSFDELAAQLKLELSVLTQTLMMLEINGLLQTVPGGYQRI